MPSLIDLVGIAANLISCWANDFFLQFLYYNGNEDDNVTDEKVSLFVETSYAHVLQQQFQSVREQWDIFLCMFKFKPYKLEQK